MENKEKLSALIDGCLKNDRRSQSKLFKLYYGKLLSLCLRYISDKDKAQDVLQEGFIKVFEKLGTFDYTGSFEVWMRRIITYTAIDAFRKSKKDPLKMDNENEFSMNSEDPVVLKEEMELSDLKVEVALEAIQKLSPTYRTVFNLYVLEDYSHKEISKLLGIGESTSKSNLCKAKINLNRILKTKLEKQKI